MGISGSQKALMFAQSGVERSGATRSGYHSSKVFLSIAGVQYGEGRADLTKKILVDSLAVTDVLDQVPNTLVCTAYGFTPTEGQEIIGTLGSINNFTRFFAGQILITERVYQSKPSILFTHVRAIDYSGFLLNRRKVTKRYTGQSASAIAPDIIASFTSGFTSVNVAAGLPTIDEITFTEQDVNEALDALAKRIGGYWYIDYNKDLHFFLTDTSETNPQPLVSTHPTLMHVQVTRDLSPVKTRVYVEGGGANARADCAPGDTIVPVEDSSWYNVAGGTFTSGPQRVSYTSVQAGGIGSVVGVGVTPSVAPSLAPIQGAGLGTGSYSYAYTDVTGSGETLPSPLGTTTTGPLTSPTIHPTLPNNPSGGTGADPGVHTYGITFAAGSGETDVLTSSNNVTTYDLGSPGGSGSASEDGGGGNNSGAWAVGATVDYGLTFIASSGETVNGPASNSVVATVSAGGVFARIINVTGIPTSSDPNVTQRRLYRRVNGTFVRYFDLGLSATSLSDSGFNSSGSGSPPGSSTVQIRAVNILGIQLGPAGTTARKLYRTAAGGSQLKLLTTISDNTTTSFLDQVTDASLGANAPTTNTTGLNQVNVSSIAIGPATTTSRKLYRTAVGGSQLKLLTTIADNTTTTYADSTADGSLGANVPTSDTSGLPLVAGQVNAGSTTLLTTGTGPFSAGGGWAIAGSQVLRYTGISGNSLTGIPASGSGAIGATITYGTSIVAAPSLVGIPASGAGAIVYTINQGDEINLLAKVDDTAAQTALAALIGGDGIQEDYLQDRRLSETEARARGTAQLALKSRVQISVRFTTRDINTRAGRTIHVDLSAFSINSDFKLQQVQIANFGIPQQMPTCEAEAASTRFSLEDLLRIARKATAA